ncbi:hypothetical protein JCM14469_40510 [Desulfatiferula olefinivorans]
MEDTHKATTQTIGPFDRTILNSLSAHIALLDKDGLILETNRAWNRFGKINGMDDAPAGPRYNYLDVCDQTRGDDEDHSKKAARGIRDVIRGNLEEFTLEYPCHSPTEKKWFFMRVNPIRDKEPFKVIVSHENITELKLAEEVIRNKEAKLFEQTLNLEETNSALKVLLRQRDADKEELEEKVLANVEHLAFPYIEKLKSSRLNERQSTYLGILEAHLKEIISPFLLSMSRLGNHLTPQELQVAHLVKSGKTSKEIAEVLTISVNTVDFHRKHIRDKLGLRHTKTNLQSYLMQIK